MVQKVTIIVPGQYQYAVEEVGKIDVSSGPTPTLALFSPVGRLKSIIALGPGTIVEITPLQSEESLLIGGESNVVKGDFGKSN